MDMEEKTKGCGDYSEVIDVEIVPENPQDALEGPQSSEARATHREDEKMPQNRSSAFSFDSAFDGTKGKDELNIAEFPLSVLSNRAASNQKTLVFKDEIWDKGNKELVKRKLTITAADAYGLPTALDDDILLGLIQLTKQQGFRRREVKYTRYQILKVLGWADESANYRRVKESLNRWTGVTLNYEKAWWNSETKEWMDETFHILDRVSNTPTGSENDNLFEWNRIPFESFERGNLKTLNHNEVKKLHSPIAKRLYRLLDKRFHHRSKIGFDLNELGFDKLGLSKNHNIGNLKRLFNKAYAELEGIGFIKKKSVKERYSKISVGIWHILFEKGVRSKTIKIEEKEEPKRSSLESSLVELGVSSLKAKHLVATKPKGYIESKIELTRFFRAKGTGKALCWLLGKSY